MVVSPSPPLEERAGEGTVPRGGYTFSETALAGGSNGTRTRDLRRGRVTFNRRVDSMKGDSDREVAIFIEALTVPFQDRGLFLARHCYAESLCFARHQLMLIGGLQENGVTFQTQRRKRKGKCNDNRFLMRFDMISEIRTWPGKGLHPIATRSEKRKCLD